MKKLFFAIVAGFIPALVVTTGVYAQYSNFKSIADPAEAILFSDSIAPKAENASTLSNISSRALKEFSKTHSDIANENWYVIQDGFVATFKADDVSTTVYYNKKGRWAGYLKGYNEAKLPRSVRDLVKRQYYDFAITYVHELETVESEGKPTYIVHLEDAKNILQVRVNDGIMEEWRKYDKQK